MLAGFCFGHALRARGIRLGGMISFWIGLETTLAFVGIGRRYGGTLDMASGIGGGGVLADICGGGVLEHEQSGERE